MAKSLSTGNTLMDTKTIYNINGKSQGQIESILMFVQEAFLAAHSTYEYSDRKYEDGNHGDRTFYLIFKLKSC